MCSGSADRIFRVSNLMTLRVGALINSWVPEERGESSGLFIRMHVEGPP